MRVCQSAHMPVGTPVFAFSNRSHSVGRCHNPGLGGRGTGQPGRAGQGWCPGLPMGSGKVQVSEEESSAGAISHGPGGGDGKVHLKSSAQSLGKRGITRKMGSGPEYRCPFEQWRAVKQEGGIERGPRNRRGWWGDRVGKMTHWPGEVVSRLQREGRSTINPAETQS